PDRQGAGPVTPKGPSAVVLLGAQRFDPTLGAAVAELGVTGRIATITAGWQERELEDEELSEHLGRKTVNLRLHTRGEELFAADPELRAAHRERQEALRHRQDFYRIRLEHQLDADHVIRQRVAPLINRMKLFGIGELAGGRVVFAWSGGAMAVSEQVVLFHDDPPQGPGASEVLDTGLGICRGAVVFPEPEKRLRLDRKDLVARMARRFSPCFWLALPGRSRIISRAGRFDSTRGVQCLRADGEAVPSEPQGALR